ncbi:ATP-binding protein [Moraxella nasovis]|uniref:ATP-binding protein n=1 Tax=Moraxella nasovis TaxID=2904121 RepID=UPI001F60A33E|nr:ATP-binding protein [Moraxella nasovis]UNU72976.1 ATP-binding protein [Moraxella nasovis]
MMMVLVGVLSLCVAVLFLVAVSQFYHLKRLTLWLQNSDNALQASDVGKLLGWQRLYDELFKKERSRQKRDDRLHRTINRLNRMMTAIPSAVLIVDEKGGIAWKNGLAEDYLSLKNNKLPLIKQVNDKDFIQFLSAKEESGVEQKLSLNQKTLLCTLIPIEANARMLIAHDVSASEQLIITKNAFIANVSHELRTPLTVIQGFLETLQDNELPRELQLEFIGMMSSESRRMLGLIEDLLTLSHLENDDPRTKHQENINLSELIDSIVKDARHLSDSHHIHADITPDIYMLGVYKELYSAFSNLIFNAIRHTENGTEVRVHLSADDEIEFFVQDNGGGISGEHLAHLTERFYRVDKGRSRKTGGSGLGLAIAKHALARHGGVLGVHSEVGVGSKFGVKIPMNETVK